MPNRWSLIVGCAVLVFASGCGTIGNFSEGQRMSGGPPAAKVFGGVREDIECLTETAWGQFPLGVVMLADLPLSLAGDVFTLPWAIRAARLRKGCPAYPPVIVPDP